MTNPVSLSASGSWVIPHARAIWRQCSHRKTEPRQSWQAYGLPANRGSSAGLFFVCMDVK